MGQGPDGITAADLGKKVMGALVEAAQKAVTENASKLGKGGELLKGGAADSLKKGVGDFLKTK